MLDGRNKYTTTAGLPELRKVIAESWSDYDSNLDENNVCMTMSGTNALFNCFMALIEEGNNILIPEENGGLGLDLLFATAVAQSLGEGIATLPFTGSYVMAPISITYGANDRQK